MRAMNPTRRFVTSITLDDNFSQDRGDISVRTDPMSEFMERVIVPDEGSGNNIADNIQHQSYDTGVGAHRIVGDRSDDDVYRTKFWPRIGSPIKVGNTPKECYNSDKIGTGSALKLPAYLQHSVDVATSSGETDQICPIQEFRKRNMDSKLGHIDQVLLSCDDLPSTNEMITSHSTSDGSPGSENTAGNRVVKPIIRILSNDLNDRVCHNNSTKWSDCEVNGFRFLCDSIPSDIVSNSGYIWLNYPESNPSRDVDLMSLSADSSSKDDDAVAGRMSLQQDNVPHQHDGKILMGTSPDYTHKTSLPALLSRDWSVSESRDYPQIRPPDLLNDLKCGCPEITYHRSRCHRITWPPFQPIKEVDESDDDDDYDDDDDDDEDDDIDDTDGLIDEVFEERVLIDDINQVGKVGNIYASCNRHLYFPDLDVYS